MVVTFEGTNIPAGVFIRGTLYGLKCINENCNHWLGEDSLEKFWNGLSVSCDRCGSAVIITKIGSIWGER